MGVRTPKSWLYLTAKVVGLFLFGRLLYAVWDDVAELPLSAILPEPYRIKPTTPTPEGNHAAVTSFSGAHDPDASLASSVDHMLGPQTIERVPLPSVLPESNPTVELPTTEQAASSDGLEESTTTSVDLSPAPQATAMSQDILPESTVASFVHAILNPDATEPPRLECPRLDEARYKHLQAPRSPYATRIKYFFVLDLRNCLDILPRLLGSIVEVVRFLGPEACAMSIVEGNSTDGTPEVLRALRAVFPTTFLLQTTTVAAERFRDDRVERLAELRNLALAPMLEWAGRTESAARPDPDTTVIFSNDVAACAEDFLELLHQRRRLGADMVCPMDWSYIGPEPTFYDSWVARDMSGNGFFKIGDDGSWDQATDLFPVDRAAAERYRDHAPFQVFSCWNGIAVFQAEPVLLRKVAFRAPVKDVECYQGEPQLFCKDLWHNGYGKIAVVPSVNLEYSNEYTRKIKALKGYASDLVGEPAAERLIEWKMTPPAMVRCMPTFNNQFMQEWDVGL